MEAVLVASGELGYRETSVRAILDYSGGNRAQFYKYFESRDDCFTQAYATWIERLCSSLLKEAVTTPGWEAGIREAIARLFRFVNRRSAIARALFVEVHIAGEPALARHEATIERLAAAVDSVRGEIPPTQAPPDATGTFVVAGVESCIAEALGDGNPKRLWGSLPELMHFAVGCYFGQEAGEGAFERASIALQREWPRLMGAEG